MRILLDSVTNREEIKITLSQALYDLEAIEVYDRPDALSNLLRSSQQVHVLTEDYLARRQTGTFAGALTELPGVNSMQVGVGIAKPVIRGMSFNRILVNNRVDIKVLSIDKLEHVHTITLDRPVTSIAKNGFTES
jgi:iron complex outermembrane receptor protein